MKIRFLGTGAADWNGMDGRGEHRRYTSTLFDNSLLIDCSTQVFDMIPKEANIRHILITHSHSDHFDSRAIAALSPCEIYVHESWAQDICIDGIHVHPIAVGKWINIGSFDVMALPASHPTQKDYEQPVHYLLHNEGKYFLYALDGAWMLHKAVRMLKGIHLCGMAIDATIGDGHEGDYRVFEHNSLPMIRIMTDTMRRTSLLNAEAPVFLTHMARTLHPTHSELCASLCAPYVACFDGMEVIV